MAAPESTAPHVPGLLARLRRAGLQGVLAALRRRARSDAVFLGLRCDLQRLPPQRPAALPLEVTTEATPGFEAFAAAAALPEPSDLGELRLRQRLVDGGVRTLHVARSEGLGVVYTQWCVAADDLPLIAAVLPDHFRTLGPGEVLLEGAYTFPQARRAGVMGDVMWRLLDDARAAGSHTAYTYVERENVASLRGCAAVGFTADHERRERWRLGRWRARLVPLSEAGRAAWAAATAPRSA